MAQEEASKSHGLVFVLDVQDLDVVTSEPDCLEFKISPGHQILEAQLTLAPDSIIVINKLDLLQTPLNNGGTLSSSSWVYLSDGSKRKAILVSIEQNQNIDKFLEELEQRVKDKVGSVTQSSVQDSESFIVTR